MKLLVKVKFYHFHNNPKKIGSRSGLNQSTAEQACIDAREDATVRKH